MVWSTVSTKEPKNIPMQAPSKPPITAPNVSAMLLEKSDSAKPVTPPKTVQTSAPPMTAFSSAEPDLLVSSHAAPFPIH